MFRTFFLTSIAVSFGVLLSQAVKWFGVAAGTTAIWCFWAAVFICFAVCFIAFSGDCDDVLEHQDYVGRTWSSLLAMAFSSAGLMLLVTWHIADALIVCLGIFGFIAGFIIFVCYQTALFTPKNRTSDFFCDRFGFPPSLLDRDGYKKEVLLKLGMLAAGVSKEAKSVAEYPGNSCFLYLYDKKLKEYEYALELVKYYDPEFVAQIPHWSELSEFVQAWLNGEKVNVRPSNVTQLRRLK